MNERKTYQIDEGNEFYNHTIDFILFALFERIKLVVNQ